MGCLLLLIVYCVMCLLWVVVWCVLVWVSFAIWLALVTCGLVGDLLWVSAGSGCWV